MFFIGTFLDRILGSSLRPAEINLGLWLFVLVIVIQLIEWVGKSVLQEGAFSLYSRLFLSSAFSKQRALRRQVLDTKAELSRTSSQDEFAKWAKLKRKLDKSLQDLEASNTALSSARTRFTRPFSTLIWLLTSVTYWILVWGCRKFPVFWLPNGWAPGVVGWALSFPSAPKGSVSSAVWAAVCKRVIKTLGEVVRDLSTPTAAAAAPNPFAAPPVPAASGASQPKQSHTIEPEKLD